MCGGLVQLRTFGFRGASVPVWSTANNRGKADLVLDWSEAKNKVPWLARRWKWVGLGAILLGLVASIFAIEPVVRKTAVSEAEARGVELSIGEVKTRFLRVVLSDVEFRPEGVPGVEGTAKEIEIRLGMDLRPSAIEVRDATVRIEGAVDRVKQDLAAWRGRRGGVDEKSAAPAKAMRRDLLERVRVEWKGAFAPGDEQLLDDVHFERSAEGQRLAMGRVHLEHPHLAADLAGVRAAWSPAESGFELVDAEIAEARVHGESNASTEEAPAAASAVGGPDEASDQADLLDRLPALDPSRGPKIREWIVGMASRWGQRLPARSSIESLWLELARDEQQLHFGPSRLEAKRSPHAILIDLVPRGESRGTPLALHASIPRKAGEAVLKVEGGPVSLDTLGVREGDFGLVGVGQGEIGGLVEARLSADGQKLTLEGRGEIQRVAVASQRLSPGTVTFPKLRLEGRSEVELSGARYAVESASLKMGAALLEVAGSLVRGEDYVETRMKARAPLVSCQELLDSAPRGILDRLEGARLSGTFSLDAAVDYDSRHPKDMKVVWDFQNECKVTEVPGGLSPRLFFAPFEHEVVGPEGYPMTVQTGPGTPAWSRIDSMTPYLEAAVLTCEDGRFFRHDGFDARAIESAIRDNVRKGRFFRGASTVSMQLAKNLYLNREKHLSRKLQEALLTVLLEQELSKHELLELYLNVVEFGPGVYGIRQAAEYYFRSTPERLTLGQAFFLISILPAPTRDYFESDGHLEAGRQKYVEHLIDIAHRRGHLTEAEVENARVDGIRFGVPEVEVPTELLDEGTAPSGGPVPPGDPGAAKKVPVRESGAGSDPVMPMNPPALRPLRAPTGQSPAAQEQPR